MKKTTCIVLGIILNWLFGVALAADFTLTSTAFSNNQRIPQIYSCDGKDVSPDLTWKNAPVNTKSFALVLGSPDWSAGSVYLWLLYNIPPDVTKLEKGASKNLPDKVLVGMNWYDESSYRGPCPPDSLLHHYVFTLYALNAVLDLPDDASSDDLIAEIQNHTIKQVKLTGLYSH